MSALQPVILLIVCIAFWSIVGKVKKYTTLEYRAKLISTMIVILFLVHPDIADIMFSSFNCVKVDDKYRMTENIRSVCY
jgi:glycerol-3-phosphate acyltransferase PlsY